MNTFKRTVAKILGVRPPARNLRVYPDDRFLVSYPRSGNTWVRFLIANLITTDEVDFRTIEKIIPDIYQNSPGYLDGLGKPRILKSHEYFDPRYRKVLYIVRDPRDVCVSYFHYHRKNRWIDPESEIDSFVDDFLQGSLRGGFGSWFENVGSWLGARKDDSSFMAIRYEDLLKNPGDELNRIALFLELRELKKSIDEAIELSNADSMRKLEKHQAEEWSTTRSTDQSIPFIRKAESRSWQEELSVREQERIKSAFGAWMEFFGYLENM